MNANTLKAQAQQQLQQGNPAAVINLLRAAAPRYKDADIWFLLGAAYGMTQDLAAAEHAFRKTVELAPGGAGGWENLGRALMHQQQYDEAERCLQRAISLNPGSAASHACLGELYRNKGEFGASTKALQTAVALEPGSAAHQNQLGATLEMAGELQNAIEHYRKSIALQPRFPDARLNLANALSRAGQLEEAVQQYQIITGNNPQSVPAWHGLASALLSLNRWQEALKLFKHILTLNPRDHMAHIRVARVLLQQNDMDSAVRHLELARPLQPATDPDIAGLAADIAILQGDHAGALRAITPALAQHPNALNLIQIQAALAERGLVPAGTAISAAENLLRRRPSAPETLLFSLARLYEKSGQYDEAFTNLQQAHRSRNMDSDLTQHLEEMDRIQEFFTRDRFSQLATSGSDDKLPVFIVGMPRSGTSLVEQILATHPDVYGAGEITRLWEVKTVSESQAGTPYPESLSRLSSQQMSDLAAHYLDFVRGLAPDARRVCDKLPHNFLHLGLVQQLFPGATVIHCTRDPRDTCLSIFTHRFNINHRYAQSLGDLGRYYRRYEKLMSHWGEVLDLNILTFEYEALISDQEQQTRRLLEGTGLSWDEQCLAFHATKRTVVTPSFEQVRQPLYSSSVQRWRHYEPHLGELLDALSSD